MLVVVCDNHHIAGYNPPIFLKLPVFITAHIGFSSVLEVVSYPFPETNSKFASENSNAFQRLSTRCQVWLWNAESWAGYAGEKSLKKPAINTKGLAWV